MPENPVVNTKSTRQVISRKDNDPEVRYKFWDLTAQYCTLAIAFLSLLVAIGGFYIVWRTLKDNRGSLERNTQSVRADVQNGITKQVAGLSKVFMDKPELYQYFFSDVEPPDPQQPCIPPGSKEQKKVQSPCYAEVLAVAIYKADVMDIVATQRTHFPDLWDDPEAWDKWVDDSIKKSPIMREYLLKKCTWYGKTLIKHLRDVVPPKDFPDDCQDYLGKERRQ